MENLKLIKQGEDYKLYLNDGSCFATTMKSPYKRLSKSNCDEIFGVVDVEKLAKNFTEHFNTIHVVKSDIQVGYKEGFKKCIELQKDKLFTVEDMKQALFDLSDVMFNNCQNGISEKDCLKYRNMILESLKQPTEIAVEIVTTEIVIAKFHRAYTQNIYKLDENNCIILKRKA